MITIDAQLKSVAQNVALGVVEVDSITVESRSEQLWNELKRAGRTVGRQCRTTDELRRNPEIASLDATYRALGKDPRRYPGSAEALALRILENKGLYQVNTAVDLNNLVSLNTLCSVGVYDQARLQGPPLVFRVGVSGETYTGIGGKREINIEGLPVFADAHGPYGSPTADSDRAKITLETTRLLLVIITFAGVSGLLQKVNDASVLVEQYLHCHKDGIKTYVVE